MGTILLHFPTTIVIFVIIVYVTSMSMSYTPVYGHASPVTYEPAPNEIFDNSLSSQQHLPDKIVIDFTESPEIRASSIKVVNSNNERIDNNDLSVSASPKSLSVSVDKSKIIPGVYTVSWAVLSKDDGHITKGSYVFTVTLGDNNQSNQSQNLQLVKNTTLGYSRNTTDLAGNIDLKFDIIPFKMGQNTFNISVSYTNGTFVENIRDIFLEFNNPSKNLGPIVEMMDKIDVGRYSSSGSFLSQGGIWDIKITIQRIGEYDINQQIKLDMKD